MTVNSWFYVLPGWIALEIIDSLLGIAHLPAVAQVIPDGTLGAESSIVVPLDDTTQRIDGGALRGSSLFHSFQEFGIPEGMGVYFSDPQGISTIFSRITGSNPSAIFGTLGVFGDANLFLLNPNGILFGPNAQLNLGGSFVGSTADSLTLPGGGEFSATNPTAVPLLDVQMSAAPVGLLFEGEETSIIVNGGNLAVESGHNLALVGGTVVSAGEVAAPGGEVAIVSVQGDGNGSPGQAQLTQTGELRAVSSAPIGEIAPPEQLQVPQWSTVAGLTNGNTGQVTVGDSEIPVQAGDVVVQQAAAGAATISAANDLTLVESELFAEGDLRLQAQDTVRLRDSVAMAGSNLQVTGDAVVDIATTDTSLPAGNSDLRAGAEQAVTINGGEVILSAAVTAPGGTVTITGERIGLLDGTNINVSAVAGGGEVLIGTAAYPVLDARQTAARTYIAPEATITADGLNIGDGGQVVVWAEEVTGFYGEISAQGGAESGNGGFVEVSGRQHLLFRGDVDVTAASGDSGTLLLDPTDIIIAAGAGDGAGDGEDTFTGNNSGVVGSILSAPLSTFDDTAPTTIYESELERLSGDTDIVLQATNDITIQDLTTFTQAGLLRFAPGTGRIEFVADADNNGIGSVTMDDRRDRIQTRGRDLVISGNNLYLGNISSSPDEGSYDLATSDAGNITITGSGTLEIGDINSSVYSFSYETEPSNLGGNGGAISITNTADTGRIAIGNINSSTIADADFDGTSGNGLVVSAGNAGSVTITGSSDVVVGDVASRSLASTYASLYGDPETPADIETQARTGGSVMITGGGTVEVGRVSTNSLAESSFAEIFFGEADVIAGEAGQVTISGGGDVSVSGIEASSTVFYSVPPTNNFLPRGIAGTGGNIRIESRNGSVATGDFLRAFSFSDFGPSGDSGNITLRAITGSIQGNSSQAFAFSIAQSGSTSGNAGNLTLEAGNAIAGFRGLTLSATARSGTAQIQGFGNLLIQDIELVTTAQGQIEVELPEGFGNTEPIVNLDTGTIGQSGGTVIAGTANLTLENVAVQADANGSQPAGGVIISSPGQVTLNVSRIDSNANRDGAAGQIVIDADQIDLNDGVAISASTRGTGEAGRITLTGQNVTIRNGATVQTNTLGPQDAGDIKFNVTGTLDIDGGSVESSTTPDSTGAGGDIVIDPIVTRVRNGGRLAATSEGSGIGGNITVFSGRLILDNGQIITNTLNNDGGNITLTLTDILFLSNGSQISTNAGANGGNIEIDAPFIIAIPIENSDITANAEFGNGGNVRITTQGLFGIAFRDRLTPLSDITASSQFGLSGNVEIDALETDPTRNLTVLPEETVNTNIQQSCQADGNSSNVAFFDLGRGGVPTSPEDFLSAEMITNGWTPLASLTDSDSESRNSMTSTLSAGDIQQAELLTNCMKQ